ncbi:hypothetical protein [Mycolicibacterium fortuitum]|nr:hypothetical protein [Mycolicibacterium fortuitum]MBP3087316.1 hypothetical protein [Mycolicibacterium fortuitum]
MIAHPLAAAGSAAYSAGYLVGALFIPGLGLLLLTSAWFGGRRPGRS